MNKHIVKHIVVGISSVESVKVSFCSGHETNIVKRIVKTYRETYTNISFSFHRKHVVKPAKTAVLSSILLPVEESGYSAVAYSS
jgi:hypothetical protein